MTTEQKKPKKPKAAKGKTPAPEDGYWRGTFFDQNCGRNFLADVPYGMIFERRWVWSDWAMWRGSVFECSLCGAVGFHRYGGEYGTLVNQSYYP